MTLTCFWFFIVLSLLISSALNNGVAECSDAMKSWGRLNSGQTIKQVFFITARGTQGISPPNVHAKHPVISG